MATITCMHISVPEKCANCQKKNATYQCRGCSEIYYCGKECYLNHKSHGPVCKRSRGYYANVDITHERIMSFGPDPTVNVGDEIELVLPDPNRTRMAQLEAIQAQQEKFEAKIGKIDPLITMAQQDIG